MKLGMAMMAVLAVIGWCNASSFVTFFRNDPAVIEIGTQALRLQCLSLILMPTTLYGNMLFQSIGLSGTATFLAALRSGIVLIPVLLILTHFFGLGGLECAQAVSETLSTILTIPFIIHFLKCLPQDGQETSQQ